MKFYFALLLLFGAYQASAAPRLAGLEAGQAAYEAACARSYGEFERRIAFRRKEDNVIYDREERIRQRFGLFQATETRQNVAYIKMARAANLGQATPIKSTFVSESAVIKELNEKVVLNKLDVTSLTNQYKDLELAALERDPELASHVLASYSDFKSMHFALDTADPAIRARLEKAVEEINRRYAQYLEPIAKANGWSEKGGPLSGNPANWFHIGEGATTDEAAIAARASRDIAKKEGKPRLVRFSDLKQDLAQSLKDFDQYSTWLEQRFTRVPGFLKSEGKRKILSAELIETLKKAPAGQQKQFIKYRFKIDLSDKELASLENYLSLADSFSPPLLVPERVIIDLGQDAVSVISADFKGQNARNLEETMKALAKTEGQNIDQRIRAVREGEERATEVLNALKEKFQQVFQKVQPERRASLRRQAEFTGDDGIGFLNTPVDETTVAQAYKLWIEAGGSRADLRLTFQNLLYADTGKSIPAALRSTLITRAEKVEKDLRLELIKHITREELNDTQILVSLTAREVGEPLVKVTLVNGNKVSESTLKRTRQILKEWGVAVESVGSI